MSYERVYVRFKGKTLGPLPPQKIRDLIRRGQITRLHELSGDGVTWKRAEQIPELFQSAAPKASASPGTNSAEGSSQASSAKVAAAERSPDAPSSQPRTGESPEATVQWYIHSNGANLGPFSSPEMVRRIETGEMQRDVLVWRAGYDSWRAAEESFPDHFGGSITSVTPGDRYARTAIQASGSGEIPGLTDRLACQRGWTLFVSISTLVFAALAALYFVVVMVVGAEQDWAPFEGSGKVVYGLCGLVFCGVLTAGAILLLRYAAAIKMRTLMGDPATAVVAIGRLASFWRYVGITLLTVEVFLIGGAILLLVISFAAADALS